MLQMRCLGSPSLTSETVTGFASTISFETMETQTQIEQTGNHGQKGRNGVSIQNPTLSDQRDDPMSSVEVGEEDSHVKDLTRKLLWKLDTRCVFFSYLSPRKDRAN